MEFLISDYTTDYFRSLVWIISELDELFLWGGDLLNFKVSDSLRPLIFDHGRVVSETFNFTH